MDDAPLSGTMVIFDEVREGGDMIVEHKSEGDRDEAEKEVLGQQSRGDVVRETGSTLVEEGEEGDWRVLVSCDLFIPILSVSRFSSALLVSRVASSLKMYTS